jgi:hypothetical protein
MIFNDPINKQGIIQEIDDICSSDNNSYPIASKTRRVNSALDRFFKLAMQADGRWEEDDITYQDYPVATTPLEANKYDYTFPSELLELFRVEIKNKEGKWVELTPIDQSDIKRDGLLELANRTGEPTHYDKQYGSLWLYPKPDYSENIGIKLYYNRKLQHFVPTDTGRKAGVPPIFNQYICRVASMPFLVEKVKANKNDISQLIQQDEIEVKKYYSRRGRDEKPVIRARGTSFI